ncbi:MAG TPA: hypothetical protein VHK70_08250 [Burkholderiaceae bacterium]|jgi:hypothetical protein|nr:hypothetical protein [Burkholderiaceae bacterium]
MRTLNILAAVLLVTGMAVLNSADAQQAIDFSHLSEDRIAIADLSKADDPGKTFLAATVIGAPLQRICSIILDFPDYPSFMPNTDKTRIVYTDGEHSVVDITLKLPLGKIKRYRLKMESKTGGQSCRLSWKLIPWEGLTPDETIADTSGYWRLAPHPANADKTIVEYFVYADPGRVPFGLGWIVDWMSERSLPKTLEAVRDRALAH